MFDQLGQLNLRMNLSGIQWSNFCQNLLQIHLCTLTNKQQKFVLNKIILFAKISSNYSSKFKYTSIA